MKTIYVILCLIFIAMTSFTSAATKNLRRLTVTDPARAIWYEENKIKLTLPGNLNVNGGFFYFLKNDMAQKRISLSVHNAHDRVVIFDVSSFSQEDLGALITGPLSVITTNVSGDILDETSLQLAGILDKRFYYEGNDLGPTFGSNLIGLKLWAPTAISVEVLLFRNSTDPAPETTVRLLKQDRGVWSTKLNLSFDKYFYLYKVTVYSPNTKMVETSIVTDPYSKSLSLNSKMSQLMNSYSPELTPLAWKEVSPKRLRTSSPVIYETHLRDLTAADTGVALDERGTFLAITRPTSLARLHLKSLAENGLTHIHLMPINDFASVNEKRSARVDMDLGVEYSGNSDQPQVELNRIRQVDSYNWGYDPFHYFVPEGSYAKNPNGASRILELRSMIQSLNQLGLKVIVDVVFNHTYSSGNDQFSVLNKIVPLYYYRLNDEGNIFNSSCCSDTASENKMMEKLMIDAVVYWAKAFKIDGFRFDLMSFHTKENLLNLKKALSQLTLEKDGVDGKSIFLYGEGWNFGSLVEKNSSVAFTQLNSFGAGIGFFNDRMRDALRGGTTDSTEKSDQGFLTGLYYDFNHEIANRNTPTDSESQKNKLNFLGDVVKIGLAGNLRDYQFKNSVGSISVAGNYQFRGQPVGYAATTDETINYVSVHDGYALWDAISAKAPFYSFGRNPPLASVEEKQRMQALGLAFVLFSQGTSFIEGGSEILRSKSGDVDSYDSGDWFNRLNFSLTDNNWGKGLPPSFKNYNDWSFWSPRLNDPAMRPSASTIKTNLEMVKAFLRIRRDSGLFRAKTAAEVQSSVRFIDNDFGQIPGLIGMHLMSRSEEMLILFNVGREALNFSHPFLGKDWSLHPSLSSKVDPKLNELKMTKKDISLPGRSVVVLVPTSRAP